MSIAEPETTLTAKISRAEEVIFIRREIARVAASYALLRHFNHLHEDSTT